MSVGRHCWLHCTLCLRAERENVLPNTPRNVVDRFRHDFRPLDRSGLLQRLPAPLAPQHHFAWIVHALRRIHAWRCVLPLPGLLTYDYSLANEIN